MLPVVMVIEQVAQVRTPRLLSQSKDWDFRCPQSAVPTTTTSSHALYRLANKINAHCSRTGQILLLRSPVKGRGHTYTAFQH